MQGFNETFDDLSYELETLLGDPLYDEVLKMPLSPVPAPDSVMNWGFDHSHPVVKRERSSCDNSEGSTGANVALPSSPCNTISTKITKAKNNHAPARGKPSRWNRDKNRLGSLEQQEQTQRALVDAVEKENRQLKLRTTAMEHTLAARERLLAILNQYSRLCGPGSALQGTDEAQHLSKVAAGSITTLATMYRAALERIAALLLQISSNEERKDTAANEPLLVMLTPLVHETCMGMGEAFTLNPSIQFQMAGYRLDLLSSGELPARSHWDRVVRELHLSQQQLDEVAACWDLNHASMFCAQTNLLAAREQLSEPGMGTLDGNLLRQMQLQKVLSAAMQNEGMAYRTLCFTLYQRILTPLQMARVGVHSFPLFPNARDLTMCMLNVQEV